MQVYYLMIFYKICSVAWDKVYKMEALKLFMLLILFNYLVIGNFSMVFFIGFVLYYAYIKGY